MGATTPPAAREMGEAVTDGLVAALARAQANFPTIGKNRTNPHYKSQYADLAAILAAVRPVLAAEGIALIQPTDITEHGVELVTALLLGDERMESRWPLPIDGLDPQKVGSLKSYIRRYQLQSLLGIAAEEDDDDDGETLTEVRHAAPTTGKGKAPSDRSSQYLGKLRHDLVPQENAWQRFAAAVLGEAPPEILSGPQTSTLIDALLAAKKGTWPTGMYPDEDPF